MQTDPLVESTWMSYVFCESDPVGETDPSGLVGTCGPGCQGTEAIYVYGTAPPCWDIDCGFPGDLPGEDVPTVPPPIGSPCVGLLCGGSGGGAGGATPQPPKPNPPPPETCGFFCQLHQNMNDLINHVKPPPDCDAGY